MARIKNTYDTLFMITYALGSRGSQYDDVPYTTKRDWSKMDNFDHIIGYKYMEKYVYLAVQAEQIKVLKDMVFSLIRVITIFQNIIDHLPNKNRLLFDHREQIVNATDKWIKRYSLKQVASFLNVSQQQYIAWKKGFYCKISPVSLCRKTMPGQLSIKEVSLIKQFVLEPDYKNWSLASIYFKMLRESESFFSIGTFYKYVSILGLKKVKNKKPVIKNMGPRASKPLELLHMDITEYWITDNIRVYIHVIMDNFSRKVLGYKIALNKSAELACKNLIDVYKEYKLDKHTDIMLVINDCGSENFSVTKQFIDNLPNLNQYFANKKNKTHWTNNMIEALFCKIKKFMREYEYKDFDNFHKQFENIIELCNDKIPNAATNGKTPNETFYGIEPFNDNISNLIHKSHIKRVLENKNGNCF